MLQGSNDWADLCDVFMLDGYTESGTISDCPLEVHVMPELPADTGLSSASVHAKLHRWHVLGVTKASQDEQTTC